MDVLPSTSQSQFQRGDLRTGDEQRKRTLRQVDRLAASLVSLQDALDEARRNGKDASDAIDVMSKTSALLRRLVAGSVRKGYLSKGTTVESLLSEARASRAIDADAELLSTLKTRLADQAEQVANILRQRGTKSPSYIQSLWDKLLEASRGLERQLRGLQQKGYIDESFVERVTLPRTPPQPAETPRQTPRTPRPSSKAASPRAHSANGAASSSARTVASTPRPSTGPNAPRPASADAGVNVSGLRRMFAQHVATQGRMVFTNFPPPPMPMWGNPSMFATPSMMGGPMPMTPAPSMMCPSMMGPSSMMMMHPPPPPSPRMPCGGQPTGGMPATPQSSAMSQQGFFPHADGPMPPQMPSHMFPQMPPLMPHLQACQAQMHAYHAQMHAYQQQMHGYHQHPCHPMGYMAQAGPPHTWPRQGPPCNPALLQQAQGSPSSGYTMNGSISTETALDALLSGSGGRAVSRGTAMDEAELGGGGLPLIGSDDDTCTSSQDSSDSERGEPLTIDNLNAYLLDKLTDTANHPHSSRAASSQVVAYRDADSQVEAPETPDARDESPVVEGVSFPSDVQTERLRRTSAADEATSGHSDLEQVGKRCSRALSAALSNVDRHSEAASGPVGSGPLMNPMNTFQYQLLDSIAGLNIADAIPFGSADHFGSLQQLDTMDLYMDL